MKLSILFLCSCASLATPTLAQNAPTVEAPPSPAPKFSWKLRLTKGQTWTENTAIRTHTVQQMPAPTPGVKPLKFEIDMTQTTGFKNEVMEATPAYYLVRVTYIGLKTESTVKMDGKAPPGPAPAAPQLDYAGLSYTLKQAPDGRVLDVIDLDKFLARQKKMLGGLKTTPAMGSFFSSMAPSAATFKATMKQSRSVSVPLHPLAIGEAYSYAINLPAMGALKFAFNAKRTLLSFDAEKAVFSEGGTFSVPPTQMFGPTTTAKQVTLKGAAAQLYWARTHRPTPAPMMYLSNNGRLYYREAKKTAQVIWLDPPATGVKLSESEAAPYRNVQGFNGQTTGATLNKFFPGNGGTAPAVKPVPANPITAFSLPKMFMTMKGTQSGKSTLDAVSGLTLKSDISQTITGKMTIVDPRGGKNIIPLTVTTQSTSSISFLKAG